MSNENQAYSTLKSISLKNCGINIPVGGGDFIEKVVLLISGVANKFDIKNTQYGESVVLMGQFMAVNAMTGEVFESSMAYLPDDFSSGVRKQLENSDGDVAIGQHHPVEIIVAASDRGARGYTFILRDASTPEIINQKSKMAAAMLGTLKALPAPAKSTTTKAA